MLELFLLTLAIVASIGPTNLFAIKEGVKHGASNTFFIIFGGVLVDLFYANLAGLGLSALGENLPFKIGLLSIGALVFLYLGLSGVKFAFKKDQFKEAKKASGIHPFFLGIAMTLPNPFTIIFWATALTSLAVGYQPFLLMFVVLVTGLTWALIEAGIIHFTRKLINENLLKGIELITSLVIIGFAFKFIYQVYGLVS